MFRLLKYALLFFAAYRILKMLFGDKRPVQQTSVEADKLGGMTIKKTTGNTGTTSASPAPNESEYIEYEEVR